MKTVIGLCGLKTSGKSTAFEAIKEAFPEVREIQLAKRLKDACSECLGIPRTHFDDQAYKEKLMEDPVYLDQHNLKDIFAFFGHTEVNYDKFIRPHMGTVLDSPRKAAQYVGTEVLRAIDPQIHCNGAVMDLPESGLFVVTDMRFPNEYSFFKGYECDFYPMYIQNNRAEAMSKDAHPSERLVLETAKNCEYISNNDSLMEFQRKIVEKVKLITKGQYVARS